MTIRQTPPLQTLVPAVLAAAQVGTWEYDIAADRFRCDETAALLYGLSGEEAERGVPIEQLRAVYHSEDRSRVTAEFQRAIRHGGLIVYEFRTRSCHHGLRWLLARGCYEADAQGRVTVGRGIVVDVTASKRDGYADGRAQFLTTDLPADLMGMLDHLADLALQARRVIDKIGGLTGALLRPLADALLYGIGRRIAAQMDGPDAIEDDQEDTPERLH